MLDWKIHVHTKEDVNRLRGELRGFLCGDTQIRGVSEDGESLWFDGPYETHFEARHFTGGRGANRQAVIYCEGHYGHFDNSTEAIDSFLARGCDVIAMAMPLNEPNSKGQYDGPLLTHYDFGRTPKPIWAFMHPWRVLLEWAAPRYGWENLSICGISGGGWSCALYAALDDRVRLSVPVAGVLPEALRGQAEIGDFEEKWPPLYQRASYMDLFILGAAGRKQIQIFNMYDPNYGGDRALQYVDVMRAALAPIGGEFEVWIDTTHRDHKCSAWEAGRISEQMRR